MLDYGSEDIDGMDDDADEEQSQNLLRHSTNATTYRALDIRLLV